MNFLELTEKIGKMPDFRNFKNENKDAYLCAGFFVVDFVSGNNTSQLDYFIPRTNKIATFSLNDGAGAQIKTDDQFVYKNKNPIEISLWIEYDLEKVVEIAENILKNKNKKLQKIIATLSCQNENLWNLICIFDGLGVLRMKISADSGKILEENHGTLFDMMQIRKKEN